MDESYYSADEWLKDSQYFEGQIEYIDYSGITAMYGACRCSTQVFRRSSDPVNSDEFVVKANDKNI